MYCSIYSAKMVVNFYSVWYDISSTNIILAPQAHFKLQGGLAVRLFASAISEKKAQRELAYRLLHFAVSEMWGLDGLAVQKTAQGKPFFPGHPDKHMSISHTSTHILVGVSQSEIGVDIEAIREVKVGLCARLFEAEEIRGIGFFGGWTARESIFKLTGKSNLLSQRLYPDGKNVTCDLLGVQCRVYDEIDGCCCAVACYDGNFAPGIILR